VRGQQYGGTCMQRQLRFRLRNEGIPIPTTTAPTDFISVIPFVKMKECMPTEQTFMFGSGPRWRQTTARAVDMRSTVLARPTASKPQCTVHDKVPWIGRVCGICTFLLRGGRNTAESDGRELDAHQRCGYAMHLAPETTTRGSPGNVSREGPEV